ncbi:hypothetical protein V6N12_055915 [Hibiscus sabdariffa]|uniref:Uncharacterized protein n=1 Tax=Hibiscus sabdariffa TaxID=183260 RepID=A0ABR2CSP3_9ROSI
MEAGQEDINEGRTNGNDEEKETDDYARWLLCRKSNS